MILFLYSVRDAKVEAFLPPFFERAHGAAIRSFEQACKDPAHSFAKASTDFALYYVGSFDDQTGLIQSLVAPMELARAAEVGRD